MRVMKCYNILLAGGLCAILAMVSTGVFIKCFRHTPTASYIARQRNRQKRWQRSHITILSQERVVYPIGNSCILQIICTFSTCQERQTMPNFGICSK